MGRYIEKIPSCVHIYVDLSGRYIHIISPCLMNETNSLWSSSMSVHQSLFSTSGRQVQYNLNTLYSEMKYIGRTCFDITIKLITAAVAGSCTVNPVHPYLLLCLLNLEFCSVLLNLCFCFVLLKFTFQKLENILLKFRNTGICFAFDAGVHYTCHWSFHEL